MYLMSGLSSFTRANEGCGFALMRNTCEATRGEASQAFVWRIQIRVIHSLWNDNIFFDCSKTTECVAM